MVQRSYLQLNLQLNNPETSWFVPHGGRTQFLKYHFIIIVVSTTQSRSGKDRVVSTTQSRAGKDRVVSTTQSRSGKDRVVSTTQS